MLVPLGWLRDYVALDVPTDAIVARLASLGFPVESVTNRPHLSGVVAGRLTEVKPHPNADRLQVCAVDVGGERTLTIATAATNVARDQIVPVATIGAQLPGLTIAPRKMRGIDSEGMLVSAEELALPSEWFEDGIMQLDASIPLGTDVIAGFRLLDDVIDVEVTPNRPDALCIVGIARELAAGFNLPLQFPDLSAVFSDGGDDRPPICVSLESPDCSRFVAQRVNGLRVATAPAWMRIRLALAGQRPIDNLVDISNFVMLELGEPLHFYDLARVPNRHIIVRDAKPGERLTTLDGETHELDPGVLVIADENQATGLAGVKGGSVNEVSDSTTDVLIEAATFSGPRIRRMSVKLGLRTEASGRHEKGIPPGVADVAAARAAHLLAAEGGRVYPPLIFGKEHVPAQIVALPARDVPRLLGYAASDNEIPQNLERLGFTVAVQPRDPGTFDVTVPYWRSDIAIPADLVEEFARVAGYERIEAAIPTVTEQSLTSEAFDREREIARLLAALGYDEAISLALQPASVTERLKRARVEIPVPLEIRNPLSEDQRFMRFSLFPGLLEITARERGRASAVFELGHVFFAHDGTEERNDVAIIRASAKPPAQAWRDETFNAVKSDVALLVRRMCGRTPEFERATAPMFHPGKTAGIVVDNDVIGYVGVLDPRVLRSFEVEAHVAAALLFPDDLPPYRVPRYIAPSKFPPVIRDLALVVDESVTARELETAIRAAGGDLLAAVTFFDEYRGPQVGAGKKSLAVRLTLAHPDRTMTDADADAAIGAILAELRQRTGAQLRT